MWRAPCHTRSQTSRLVRVDGTRADLRGYPLWFTMHARTLLGRHCCAARPALYASQRTSLGATWPGLNLEPRPRCSTVAFAMYCLKPIAKQD